MSIALNARVHRLLPADASLDRRIEVINGLLDSLQNKEDDALRYRAWTGIEIAAAWETVGQKDWPEWSARNLVGGGMGKSTLAELLSIGLADDPFAEATRIRDQARARKDKFRSKVDAQSERLRSRNGDLANTEQLSNVHQLRLVETTADLEVQIAALWARLDFSGKTRLISHFKHDMEATYNGS